MPIKVPRQRKQKKRQNRNSDKNGTDSNSYEILPQSKAIREERRVAIAKELKAHQGNGVVSAKKQKRLNKYIDTKLKREENQALIAKLSETKIDTSLFRSSKNLGRVRDSKKEALARALKENRAGVGSDNNKDLLFEKSHDKSVASFREKYSSSSEDNTETNPCKPTTKYIKEFVEIGGGLKRSLERDGEGRPVIKRRRRNIERSEYHDSLDLAAESEWEGFGTDTSRDYEDVTFKCKQLSPEPSTLSLVVNEGRISDSDDPVSSENDKPDAQTRSASFDTEEASIQGGNAEGLGDHRHERKMRASAFTAWATQRRNEAVGFIPSGPVTVDPPHLATNKAIQSFTPRPLEDDPLPPELEIYKTPDSARKAFSIAIERSPESMEARLALPIVPEEQRIMEAVHNNDVVIVSGATGSGKTTQIPQFLFEAGYGSPGSPTPGMIGITQPRRVAAVSMAKRVGAEMGNTKEKVSYQIRFESSNVRNAAVKFMTDGILLREISHNFALTNYSVIVIDEVHERSINTDVLIGMMTRIVELRRKMAKSNSEMKPLKLIIMSATLEVEEIARNETLFRAKRPPLVDIEGRQFPVTIHFARRTERDYVEEAFKKVSRGHKKLPPGGMLVFMTGQIEILSLCKRLNSMFPSAQKNNAQSPSLAIGVDEAPLEDEDYNLDLREEEQHSVYSDSESDVLHIGDEDNQDFEIGEGTTDSILSAHVLPLYSQLPIQQQLRVFDAPPQGSRLIVVATNVAETSLTIPGIRYVFDCGRVKERQYHGPAGIQTFQLNWISKASAKQRAGRAGRTGPGHCYRLYSSAVFEREFAAHTMPEILNTPVEGIILTLKSMGLANVINFPFPTPPDRDALVRAEQLLMNLGALNSNTKVITHVGKAMATFPVGPRFARMLLIGRAQGCLDYVIALVAALASAEFIISKDHVDISNSEEVSTMSAEGGANDDFAKHDDTTGDAQEGASSAKSKAYNKAQAALTVHSRYSDALKFLTAICAAAYTSDLEEFARLHFLQFKALSEACQLREQLTRLAQTSAYPSRLYSSHKRDTYDPKLPAPSKKVLSTLPQIAAAGFIDCIAQRADFAGVQLPHRKPKRAIHVPYVLMLQNAIDGDETYMSQDSRGDDGQGKGTVYIHPSSVLARVPPHTLPQYLVYTHLSRVSGNVTAEGTGDEGEMKISKQRVRIHPLTPITQAQLLALADGTSLLERWRASERARTRQ